MTRCGWFVALTGLAASLLGRKAQPLVAGKDEVLYRGSRVPLDRHVCAEFQAKVHEEFCRRTGQPKLSWRRRS